LDYAQSCFEKVQASRSETTSDKEISRIQRKLQQARIALRTFHIHICKQHITKSNKNDRFARIFAQEARLGTVDDVDNISLSESDLRFSNEFYVNHYYDRMQRADKDSQWLYAKKVMDCITEFGLEINVIHDPNKPPKGVARTLRKALLYKPKGSINRHAAFARGGNLIAR
jgi:hypothetical protein